MSHALTIRANGFAEFAHVGEQGWHKLGNAMSDDASEQEWLEASGMNFSIQRSGVRYFCDREGTDQRIAQDMDENGKPIADSGPVVLFRSDNKAFLSTVSRGYQVVQPKQVLSFFRDLVDGAGYKLETAGTLFGGRKFFALAKVSEAIVRGEDKIGSYLLLHTSCDGSSATGARDTTVRVVCRNTLSMATDSKGGVKVSHRSKFNEKDVKTRLSLNRDNFEMMIDQMRELSAKAVSDATAHQFVRELLRPGSKVETAPVQAVDGQSDLARLLNRPLVLADVDHEQRAPKGEADILGLFRGTALGQGMPGVRGTAWGLVNAVTAYTDHMATAKSADHRANSAWFGTGDELKSRAFELAKTI